MEEKNLNDWIPEPEDKLEPINHISSFIFDDNICPTPGCGGILDKSGNCRKCGYCEIC